MGVGGQSHALAVLFPGIEPYPLYRRRVGTQGPFGRVRVILLPSGFDPHTVKPVASCYTFYAIRPPSIE